MTKKIPVVAIIGRTNVGKSTLFNALAGRRVAIVEDVPGVTRDRSYALIKGEEIPYTLIDTGGVIGDEDDELQDSVRHQAELAIAESDLILAVVDGHEGVHPLDKEVAELLRRAEKPVLWVVNKVERDSHRHLSSDFYSLGLDDILLISAAHRQGLKDLNKRIINELKKEYPNPINVPDIEPAIRVAIAGRPNVGKSTLLNRIIGEDRVVTSEKAGTTRDSVPVRVRRNGQDFIFVDTAGLRKKARVDDHTVERYGNLRTLKALAQADVAVLVLDASEGIGALQDAKIGGLIHERGRGFVIVVNKWDAVEKDHRSVKEYTDAVHDAFKFARYAPILFVSALSGRRCPSILETVKEVYEASQTRIKTSDLNKVLIKAFEKKPPPVHRGEPVKLFFATQISVAPPTIVLFMNHPSRIKYSYERYLKNILRDNFPFPGIDLKLQFRKRRTEDNEQSVSE